MAVVARASWSSLTARRSQAHIFFIIGAFCTLVVNSKDVAPELMASEEPSEATDALDEEISVSITEASPGLFQDLEHKIINGVDVQLTWETPEDLINLHSYIVECKDADTGRQVSQLIEGGRLLTQVTVPLETPLATFDCNLLAVSTETGKSVNGSSAKFTVSTGNIAPGPVQNLRYKLINGTILEVAWDAPESSKRVDGFFVTCESISSCIDVSKQVESVGPSSMVLLFLEEPKEIFECAVLAFCTDSAGRHLNGTVTKFEVSTEGLYPPENLRLLERSDKTLSLAWAPDVNSTVWKMSAWRVLPSGDEHDSIQEHGESSGKTVKYILTDLKPWTRYNVSVQNCLENFCSEPAVLLASTDAAAPSRVENFAVVIESDVNAHFTWERPDQPNGPIDGYHLLVYNEDKKENTSFTVPGNSTEIRMHFAHEFNRFHASITAYNVAESNETVYSPVSEVEFQTFGNGPMPPRVEVSDIKDRSVHLSWKQPSDPRYLIVKFIVKVNGFDATAKPVRVNESGTTSTPEYHLSMSDLEVWKHYYVTVASCINDTTCGQDTTVEFNTEFEAPSIPLNLTIGALSSDWMLVQWEKPLISNGPLSGYNLTISDGVTRFHVTTTHLSYNYTEVVPGTSFDVTVYAFNDVDGVVKCGAVASVAVSSLESDTLSMAGIATTRILIGALSGAVLVLIIAAYVLHKQCPPTRNSGEELLFEDIPKPRRLLVDNL
ncbi:tenascin-R-like isoform X3 [Amblyomma americanum]